MVDNAMLETFRGELLEVQRILDGCTFVDLTDAKKELQAALKGMESPLQVMVMGAFSTGKSSFINALLGENVTAVGALPTTAVITKLVYGDGKDVTVYFQDETSKSYSNEEFMHMTDENDATWASTRERISYVERSLPLEVLKSINIIDSPGLEAKEIHTIITKKFVNHADVVFWMFSAENAGTGTEIKALEKLNSRLQPIAIINKMDTLDEEEDDPEEFLQDMQHKLEGKVRSVIGISARMAVDGRVKENNKLLQESNIGQVEKAIEEIVVPQTNEYKVNTLMENIAICLDTISYSLNNQLQYKKNTESLNDYTQIKIKTEKINNILYTTIEILKEYAQKEADAGNASACVFIGMLLYLLREEKDYVQKDWSCIKYLEIAAEKNSLLGQVLLAFCYLIRKENEKSEYWANIANDRLVKDADSVKLQGKMQYLLGYFAISKGEYQKGYHWYEQAIENQCYLAANNLAAAYHYGEDVDVDYGKAMKYYLMAAEHDESCAQYNVGFMYYHGQGCAVNKKKALRWIKAAAQNDYATAQYSLYNIYTSGDCGVTKNTEEAIRWLKLAADHDADSMNDISVVDAIVASKSTLVAIYAGGLNVSYTDYPKAASLGKELYEKYKDNQALNKYLLENVALSMGAIYLKGNWEIKKDLQQAIQWLEFAAAEGIDIAQHQLGLIYVNNDGIPVDYGKARYWWKKAAAQGYEPAIKDLGYLNALEKDGKISQNSGVPNNGGCLVWLTFPFGLAGFLYYWLA